MRYILLALTFIGAIFYYSYTQPPAEPVDNFAPLLTDHVVFTGVDIIDAVNRERWDYNVPRLKINQELTDGALAQARYLVENNQWNHNGLQDAAKSTSFSRLGENLARNHKNDATIVQGWLNSPAHRDIMLSVEWNEVGVGYYANYVVMWFGVR